MSLAPESSPCFTVSLVESSCRGGEVVCGVDFHHYPAIVSNAVLPIRYGAASGGLRSAEEEAYVIVEYGPNGTGVRRLTLGFKGISNSSDVGSAPPSDFDGADVWFDIEGDHRRVSFSGDSLSKNFDDVWHAPCPVDCNHFAEMMGGKMRFVRSAKGGAANSGAAEELRSRVAEDLANMLNSNPSEDPTMDFSIVVEDQSLWCHSAILAARSSVFRAMMSHRECEEWRLKRILMPDASHDVARAFLHFLYTDRLKDKLDLEMALGLLRLADKYDVAHLKRLAERYVCDNLGPDNCSRILGVAIGVNNEALTRLCLKVMADNFNDVKNSKGWQEVERRLVT